MWRTTSIEKLKGIGPKKYREFSKLGIETLEDLIYYYPRSHQDRTKIKSLSTCLDQEYAGTIVKVIGNGKETKIRGRKLTIIKVPIEDNGIRGEAIWYNMPFMKNILHVGKMYYLYGKVSKGFNKTQIESPEYQLIGTQPFLGQGIIPLYSLTSKLNQKEMRKLVQSLLKEVNGLVEEYLPTTIRKKYQLCGINFAIENIHFPKNIHDYKIAKKRLVFDELFLIQMALTFIKQQNREIDNGIILQSTSSVEHFIKHLPFQLTPAQNRVVDEIKEDFLSGKIMNRLVQGDVGSGKTVIAAIALLMTYLNGYQGAMMAPTEILANQHFLTLTELCKDFNIKITLLTGSLKAQEKRNVINDIREGKIDIIIGTHALIQDTVEFKRLGLVITDEQHRFGVKQRAILRNKGKNPHVMVMTATPIPRTLSFILYGDLDISIIDELPPGRKKIETYQVNRKLEERLYRFIKKQIETGKQAYVVCPLVEESDNIDAYSVMKLTEDLKEKYFQEEKLAFIHGKMKNKEKDTIMQEFKEGLLDVLISTTLIEVGVDVPNASIMVIQNAERFGLAQLHQLRGRVGRGSAQSYCVLITDNESKVTKERMKTMTNTNDGFLIAEKDLLIRGPGEILGIRQHGLPELKIADLLRDIEILKMVQNTCKEEEIKESIIIKEYVSKKFNKKLDKISLN